MFYKCVFGIKEKQTHINKICYEFYFNMKGLGVYMGFGVYLTNCQMELLDFTENENCMLIKRQKERKKKKLSGDTMVFFACLSVKTSVLIKLFFSFRYKIIIL